jgi:hypothetical protein
MSSPAASLLEIFSAIFWTLGGLVLLLGLFGAPFALYTRYRRKYGQSQAFQLSWSESHESAPFREGEQHFEQRLEVTSSAEWGAKLGFFLGILGFVWTPIVFLGIASGLIPMLTVGLPGLVVSWSVFFAARGFLKRGPAAVPLMRFAAVSEVVVNLWVVALVVLCTGYDGVFDDTQRGTLASALLASGRSMDTYTIPYSLQKGGVLALAYATISFIHAVLLLQSIAPLERARKLQAQEA